MQHILVIDDDPSVTSLLKCSLSYEGFAVDTASNGGEGLALARERYPALVILDIMMPGMDGLEVLRRQPPSITWPSLTPRRARTRRRWNLPRARCR